jgi:hypothetical protein
VAGWTRSTAIWHVAFAGMLLFFFAVSLSDRPAPPGTLGTSLRIALPEACGEASPEATAARLAANPGGRRVWPSWARLA